MNGFGSLASNSGGEPGGRPGVACDTTGGHPLVQGQGNTRNARSDNRDLANAIEKRILGKLGVGAQVDKPEVAVVPEPTGIDF